MKFFCHFASIAGCECEFYVGTLRGSFRDYKFWPYLNFLLERQIKLVLNIMHLDMPGESKKYTRLTSQNTASIASVLKIRLGFDR